MNNSYPAEIERLMEQRGYVKQRGTGVSVNALAREAGVHVDTVTAILRGGRSSRPRNVEAVAAALGISSSELLEAVGSEGGEVYVGPAVTRHMNDRERAALTEFLLATLDRDKKERGGNEDSTAPIDFGEERSKRRDLTQHQIDNLDHAAAPEVPDIRPDQDIP